MKNNDFKDFDISNFIELTEDQLRFEVNGGSKKSSSSSSSSSSRSNSSSSRGSSSSSSRGSSSTSASKPSSSSTGTATGSSGSGKSNTSQSSGSHEVANTNHAVANAKPGDTITRNNGTKITLTQGDINYAKAHENTPAVTITPSNPKLIAIKTNENSCTHSSSNSSGSTASGQKREAGYAMDNNAVGVAGHAGMYVENDDNSYDFFEVAPFTELHKQGEVVEEVIKNESNTPPKKIKKKILSCNSIGPLESKLTKLIGNESISGVNQYHFDNKQDMLEYLSKAGKHGGYDSYIQFNVSDDQNETILNNAIKFGEEFYDYNIIGNNCGIWAKKVLTTGDTGISDLSSMKAAGAFNFAKSLFKRSVGGIIASTVLEVVSNNVPNAIGADMFISNYFENKCELKLIK